MFLVVLLDILSPKSSKIISITNVFKVYVILPLYIGIYYDHSNSVIVESSRRLRVTREICPLIFPIYSFSYMLNFFRLSKAPSFSPLFSMLIHFNPLVLSPP